jgi:hypothetical protein
MTPLQLAARFHEAYERLAPKYGYETRPETKEFRPASPNGQLMIAVCKVILDELSCQQYKPCDHCANNCVQFKVGDKVIKGPGWNPSEFDAWGAGEGVGFVTELLSPDNVDVQWYAGSSYHQNCELLPAVGHCKDCKWWCHRACDCPKVVYFGKQWEGPKDSPPDCAGIREGDIDTEFQTGPEFGCIHYER